MKVKNLVFLFVCILFFTQCSMGREPIPLVVENESTAEIVIPKEASSQLRKSAEFFQKYFKQSTNVHIPIKNIPSKAINVHIGNTEFVTQNNIKVESDNNEAFIIKYIDENNLVILGATDWGTEYAVYDFLERFLDILWLIPTEDGADVPKINNLSIAEDVNVQESPAFLTRRLAPLDTENPNNAIDEWARINRVKKNVEFNHNLTNLFDVNKFGKSDIDFYPMIEGKRAINNEKAHDWQPNFTAKGIADVASARIIDYFKKNPAENSYSLAINDSKRFDQSKSSLARRKGGKNTIGMEDVSDDYFQWANEVASKVNAEYPDKIFGTLAYNNVYDPPSEEIGVNDNIIPFLTTERIRWFDSDFRQKDIAHTKKWLNVSKNVGWYDYVYGISYLTPRVWPHLMGEYLKWGNQNGIKYYVAELYPNWGEGPKVWLLTKLLWNPNQDVDVLLDKWYSRFAGKKAAPKLKAYFDIWEKFWTNDIKKSNWLNMESQYLPFTNMGYMQDIPDSYVSQSDKLLKEALNLTETPIQKKRVQKILDMWNVYKLAIETKKNVPSKSPYMPSLRVSKELVQALTKMKNDPLHRQISVRLLGYINK